MGNLSLFARKANKVFPLMLLLLAALGDKEHLLLQGFTPSEDSRSLKYLESDLVVATTTLDPKPPRHPQSAHR
jgi:hypothetical protein